MRIENGIYNTLQRYDERIILKQIGVRVTTEIFYLLLASYCQAKHNST